MKRTGGISAMTATVLTVALIVVGCGKGKLREASSIDLSKTPVQTVNDMFAIQTKDGRVMQRLEADVMQRYDSDTMAIDKFPEGFAVYGYTEDGLLETIIIADRALHTTSKRGSKEEVWEATGNVIIHNTIRRQTMETDTIYWNREKKEIWTDAYVKMYSPDGLMQGYGMRSDERARNSILLNPFDSYGYASQDSTATSVDTANFIGPIFKKN